MTTKKFSTTIQADDPGINNKRRIPIPKPCISNTNQNSTPTNCSSLKINNSYVTDRCSVIDPEDPKLPINTYNPGKNSPYEPAGTGLRSLQTTNTAPAQEPLQNLNDTVYNYDGVDFQTNIYNATCNQFIQNRYNEFTIGTVDSSDIYCSVIDNSKKIGFDLDSGFEVTNLGSGLAKISINSTDNTTFKCWEVNGSSGLIACGLDTVNFVAGTGITITANNSASPKTLTLNSSGGSLDAYCSLEIGNGLSNSTGYNNFAIGYNTLCSNTTGSDNFAVGYGALQNNTVGSYNIALGNSAGSAITTGSNNTIVGSLSGTAGLTSSILLGAGTCQRLRVDSTGLYINNTDIGSAITLRNIYETFTTITSATGVVIHDYSSGSIFNHTGMLSNFTVNVTNLNLSTGFVTNIILVLNQGPSNAYIPTALQIGGAAQTIRWVYGALPSGTVNAKDVVNFSFMNVGGVYTVLGQLVSFG